MNDKDVIESLDVLIDFFMDFEEMLTRIENRILNKMRWADFIQFCNTGKYP